jgi:hypothetical protein
MLLLATLAACATTAQFQQMMGGYLGAPIGDVQQRFG